MKIEKLSCINLVRRENESDDQLIAHSQYGMYEKRFIKEWSSCAHGCKTAEICLARRNRHNALVKSIAKKRKS